MGEAFFGRGALETVGMITRAGPLPFAKGRWPGRSSTLRSIWSENFPAVLGGGDMRRRVVRIGALTGLVGGIVLLVGALLLLLLVGIPSLSVLALFVAVTLVTGLAIFAIGASVSLWGLAAGSTVEDEVE